MSSSFLTREPDYFSANYSFAHGAQDLGLLLSLCGAGFRTPSSGLLIPVESAGYERVRYGDGVCPSNYLPG